MPESGSDSEINSNLLFIFFPEFLLTYSVFLSLYAYKPDILISETEPHTRKEKTCDLPGACPHQHIFWHFSQPNCGNIVSFSLIYPQIQIGLQKSDFVCNDTGNRV